MLHAGFAITKLREEEHDVTGAADIRVVNFGGSDIVLRVRLPVRPGTHRQVASEMRRRIKAAYDENGVEIPFSRHVVIFEQADGQQLNEIPIRIIGDEQGPAAT